MQIKNKCGAIEIRHVFSVCRRYGNVRLEGSYCKSNENISITWILVPTSSGKSQLCNHKTS